MVDERSTKGYNERSTKGRRNHDARVTKLQLAGSDHFHFTNHKRNTLIFQFSLISKQNQWVKLRAARFSKCSFMNKFLLKSRVYAL